MEQIIGSVSTPLALAALVVLVVFGAYQSTRSKAKGQVTDIAFWIVLAFGIMGTGAYMAEKFLLPDTIIRGEVRDTDGRPISNAIIDISGVSRSVTNETGVFEISVPPSRLRDTYTVYVFANGFKTAPTTLSGPRPTFISLTFSPNISSDLYIKTRQEVFISQNFGSPLFTFGFIENQGFDGRAKMYSGPIKITSPSGITTNFFQITHATNQSAAPGPLGTILLDRDSWGKEFSVMHATGDNGIQSLLGEIASREGNLPAWFADCWSGSEWTSLSVQAMRSFFESSFYWKPGQYQLEIDYFVEGTIDRKFYTFDVSEENSNKLLNMKTHLARCRGAALDVLYNSANLAYSDGKAQNTIMINMVPQASQTAR